MVTRKNIRSLTSAEKTAFVNAVKTIKSNGTYDQYVLMHANTPMTEIHRCPSFLPWHRQFILDFEKHLQAASGDSDMALPYWDWAQDMRDLANGTFSDLEEAVIWQDDLLGGNGDPADGNIVKTGPFRQGEWETINDDGSSRGSLIRRMGVDVPDLPTQAMINAALAISEYDSSPWNSTSVPSFRNRLEGWRPSSDAPGLHNRGHVWIGGDMAPMTSPNDPAFFLHHCFVDKIWAEWQVRHGKDNYLPRSGGPSRQNIDDNMHDTPSGTHKVSDVLDISDLGYTYDTMSGTSSSGGGKCIFTLVALGTSLEPAIYLLREFRNILCASPTYGPMSRKINTLYHRISPSLVMRMKSNDWVYRLIKYGFVVPSLQVIQKLQNNESRG